LQYSSSWTKIQPGKLSPQSNIDVVVAFLRAETQSAETQQNTSSLSRIGIGVQQVKSQNISLDQYTSNQIQAINRQNATILESGETTLAGNPAHKAVFTLENAIKLMQIWTLKGNKAYIISYQASINEYPRNLPTFHEMVESLEII
jgi:serine/threonine-protein kinase